MKPKAYAEDLAHIHDVGFGFFAHGAAPELLNLLQENGIEDGLVTDLGCGSGIWAKELADHGYDIHGIDISASMLKIARKRVPDATFRKASILEAKIPECRAVTAMGEVLNYLFDPTNSKKALTKVFRRVFDALESGGLFALDLAGPGRGGAPKIRHWNEPTWALMLELIEDQKKMRLTRKITTFRLVPSSKSKGSTPLYRRDHETHDLRLYRSTEVAKELRRVGFRVRVARSYGDFSFPKGLNGYIARKP